MPMTLDKAGKTLTIKNGGMHGSGKIPSPCRGGRCTDDRCDYQLLPCSHHAAMVGCTCKIHEWACSLCKRVFVGCQPYKAHGKTFRDWYEIEDPHGKEAP